MRDNFHFNDVNDALPRLMKEVLQGDIVGARGGSRTREMTHVGTTLWRPWRREMLVPVRKVNLAAQIAETMWVLAGRNDIEFLSHYLPRAEQFSDDGLVWRGGYGPRLRKWEGVNPGDPYVDQLDEVVKILKQDRGSRRAVMSIFDPGSDFIDSKDIPCNNWLSFLCRDDRLDLHVAIRSNDLMWGWSGINAFQWSVLQEVVAGLIGAEVGALHFSTTSLHLYETHWEKAEEISRTQVIPFPPSLKDSPRFHIDEEHCNVGSFDNTIERWFELEERIRLGYNSDQYIDEFPEPMMQSWLRVLQWWWTGNDSFLEPLEGTRLAVAAGLAIQPKRDEPIPPGLRLREIGDNIVGGSDFINHVIDLHNEKHAAYGDSWKRRGEMLGIMANIARKIDRLGKGETSDETSADTAIDLMVYLAKYGVWLSDQIRSENRSDSTNDANETLRRIDRNNDYGGVAEQIEAGLRTSFDHLEALVVEQDLSRESNVNAMAYDAYRLARQLWEKEQGVAKERDHALRNTTRSFDYENGL